jgi:hypothetical protein
MQVINYTVRRIKVAMTVIEELIWSLRDKRIGRKYEVILLDQKSTEMKSYSMCNFMSHLPVRM